ncbi:MULTISPECIES: dipeptidyl-peptidase 3 family protein [Idiomarinaceae]|uniref:Peptidase M49-like protein n=3 Tax=Pseudidiomarina TaxID=2800384 RepID=A0A368UWX2_9GAMM|nr:MULTISPECIES: Zn-dependent hydrolase [Idiomarinaceae]MDT7525850.1 Zn-dependent hydrolase [Pseudidiomarina sp. GXY010]MRJ41578.1 Zn-dependent hydrolase [Idiomarina sp. FeN1]NCU57568.1 Zn-dependent hydrolase [Idiomarina sp. FenA--70]NCU60120.1 Zn-dependent hydrolase [Idiomarina sp. FenBw--71]PWW13297.1 peptidase M49-like protein [Pseudidiomarina maritima]
MKPITLALSSLALATSLALAGCSEPAPVKKANSDQVTASLVSGAEQRLDIYYPMDLSADLSHLTDRQRHMVELLIEASEIMDDLFWQQAYAGDKDQLLSQLDDSKVKRFTEINYGPWDRLNNDQPFLTGYADKPAGANFYPADMTKAEFEAADFAGKIDLYTLIRRDAAGKLYALPYHEAYRDQLTQAAELLREAAEFAQDPQFKQYLEMRADAFLSNEYQASDFAWMDMTENMVDVVIGPIESYEDQLYGYRAAFESYVLIKDLAWSERLAIYAQHLPELQRNLPVPAAYKAEVPGAGAQLNAYDVVYYAGHSNAGSKTIAINLPNDEQVQLEKGTRRLQLKNAMRAKFDAILVPIAEQLIVPEQRQHITFDAFFANTMFHEVAHGLGIKNLVNASGTVREALKEHASALEEGKADILGLYMVTQLLEAGVITEGALEDYYTTFLAGIFRSVRFGASSAHGKANMIRFNYFEQAGAFSRNADGLYSVNMDAMRSAMNSLSEKILTLQGDGDYAGVGELFDTMGNVGPQLQADLDRLAAAAIPVDITFNQGNHVLGLN